MVKSWIENLRVLSTYRCYTRVFGWSLYFVKSKLLFASNDISTLT